jgi:hypothetical protein
MSAVFPHDAVVQRYLHTGKRRSRRKIVVASVFGVLACVVVAAALPAGAPKSEAGKSVTAEQAQTTTALAAQPVVQDVAAQTQASPPKVGVEAGTTGAAVNQPNATPAQMRAEMVTNPPAPAALAPLPAMQAVAAPTPATPPAPVAQTTDTPPAAANQAAAAPPPVAANQGAAPAPKPAVTKLSSHKTKRQLATAEKRKHLARARLQRRYAQPGYAPGYDPAYGDAGGGWQRVFIPQNDNGYD